MAIDLRDRKHERRWFWLTVIFVVLTGVWIPLALVSGESVVWQLVFSAFFSVNALLWWLYLRHERRKRETAARSVAPDPTA